MATTSQGHLDKRTATRAGYFNKDEDGMPNEKYRKVCKSAGKGYFGPRHEAHHVIPDTSLEESAKGSGKDPRYVEDVKYITAWNINDPSNLIGLPTYVSYDLYYQRKARLVAQTGFDAEKRWLSGFNNNPSFPLSTRKRWASEVGGHNPENHPIHNPVCWGHAVYNEEVESDLKSRVWNPLDDKKKTHDVDAAKVAAELKAISGEYLGKLETRGKGAIQEKWDRRADPNDTDWYKPFTMTDVPNPLLG